MLVLGIETSCDETGVAIYDSERGLIANQLHSQIALHARYGGVVPELASRDHVQRLVPLVEAALAEAQIDAAALDGIAYTAGPGLVGALLVGATFAQGLADGWGKPAVAVHHLEGHLLAPLLEQPAPKVPFVALLVSGGHTQLFDVAALGSYQLLGESVDDAAGEAFDKTAKLLGLNYPGGAALSQLATQGQADRFKFPRPMTDRPGLDFSFSGLKTAAANTIAAQGTDPQTRADIARAFEDAVVDTLLIKCKRALKETGRKQLVIAGGVSANQRLREALHDLGLRYKVEVFFPRPALCTDNGAMIALAGCLRLQAGERAPRAVNCRPRWPLSELAVLA